MPAPIINDSNASHVLAAPANTTTGYLINGNGGNDTITGTKFGDVLNGGAGNDSIKSGGGNDIITGGAGDDSLQGGSAGSVLSAGDGHDQIHSLGGQDILSGGGGNDSFIITAKYMQPSGGVDKVILDFGGAGGWNNSNNDFLAFTTFGKGSTLTFDHYGTLAGYTLPHLQYYTLHDAGTGLDYSIAINSTNGNQLGKGDYNFYG